VADLTQEQFEQLPDFVKGDYEQDGDVYRHAGFLKVKRTANELDAKLKETSGRLSEYEQKQSERQAEAERKALEKLKAEGKVDEILADAERRIGETTKQFNERIDRMANQIKTEKRSSVVSDLAELATDKGRVAFKKLIASRIDVDAETGKVTYLNDDGSASSLDLAGFKAELLKDDSLSPLLKGDVVTTGGGNVNGSNGDGRTSFGKGNMGGSREERKAAIAAKFKLPT
jgi:hypothetical protein